MKSCAACGRPPSDVCAPCLTGNPPPEKLEVDRAEREREAAEERERKHAQRIRQTQQALTDIPELQALADLFVLPGTGVVNEGYSTSQPESKPPANLDVLDLRDTRTKTDEVRSDTVLVDAMAQARRQGVLPTLTSWVRDVDEHLASTFGYVSPWTQVPCCGACMSEWANFTTVRGAAIRPIVGCCVGAFAPHTWTERTVVRECSYLLEHFTWISEQPQFAEFAQDVIAIHRDLAHACHVPIRTTRYTCTKCGDAVQPMDNGTWFRCLGCQSAWTEIELHRMAERRRPKPLPECASLAGVSVRSLRTAVAGKRLRPTARDGNTDLFALDDVLPVAAQIKVGRHSGRRKVQA